MVVSGVLGKVSPGKPTKLTYKLLLLAYVVYSVGAGYWAGAQPSGAGWRYFSWHPMLMTTGFVGMFGAAIATKKQGGYTNTKLHGIMSWVAISMALGGLYVIKSHKNAIGKPHLTSGHSIAGICVITGCLISGIIGGVFLHPDIGIEKTNTTIRFAHKCFSRMTLMMAWLTAFAGLTQLTEDPVKLAVYGVPLLLLAFPTLM